jgi:ubiquinone/menaquinone biosynthesis C-methylase UbiE
MNRAGREHNRHNVLKWNRRAADFDKKRHWYFRWFQKRIVACMHLRPGLRFLDIGCGTGWAVAYVHGRCGGAGSFSGIDISPRMIERARARVSSPALRFAAGDAHALPFPAGFFDVVMCTNAFHHFAFPRVVLSGVCRVLKKGGRFYLLDPGCDGPLMRLVDRRLRRREPEHTGFYSRKMIEEFFTRAGLTYIQSRRFSLFMRLDIGEKNPAPAARGGG